ncbi:MAG: hypothetical protein GF364_17310 [Candidatus Lokiarchaeota archaeon]|nr:hypothetical protein [Candidatus Lokiarchaeota archaeon]
MDYFGWSLWHELLLGDPKWINSMDLNVEDEFMPDYDGWKQVFSKLDYVLEKTKLKGILGGCFHTSSRIPSILQSVDMEEGLHKATAEYKSKISFEFGMHSTFGLNDLPLAGRYPEVLEQDIKLCSILGGTSIVEHPPPRTKENITKPMVELLTSEKVVNLLKNTEISLSWENMQNYKSFFGNLQNLVDFRNALGDKLNEIGEPQLIKQHLFCLDTGHLLVWRHKQRKGKRYADRIIEEFLPKFAKYLKVYHIHANDGRNDNHCTPFSLDFFDHPSRRGIRKKRFTKYSSLVMEWIKICEQYKRLEGRHIHIEALKMPFSLQQFISFGNRIKNLLE